MEPQPKSLLQKLGVKPGVQVTILGVKDSRFLRDAKRVASYTHRLGRDCPMILYAAEGVAALERLPELARALAPAGSLWIIHPKGRAEIRERDVLHAGRAAGLKDVKVVSFSKTHTARKFVIPLALRHSAGEFLAPP
jgi:hypothetical protein